MQEYYFYSNEYLIHDFFTKIDGKNSFRVEIPKPHFKNANFLYIEYIGFTPDHMNLHKRISEEKWNEAYCLAMFKKATKKVFDIKDYNNAK